MVNLVTLEQIAQEDVDHLIEAEKAYGDSWKKRGGSGAFFVICRKWDRIENQCAQKDYNIFEACDEFRGKDGLLDDIQDLRRCLMLVEEHISHEEG